jgi:hypothetical protein
MGKVRLGDMSSVAKAGNRNAAVRYPLSSEPDLLNVIS